MLSIITVTWNSYDWLDLLLESLERFTSCKYNIIVVDNSVDPIKLDNVHQIINNENIGHGAGLNLGVTHVENEFTMFLDVDCHVLCYGWEQHFLNLMNEFDVVGGKGVPQKPIRPACMFMKTEIAKKYDWQATPGYKGVRGCVPGTDVAIGAFHQMIADNVPIKLLEPNKSHYESLNGEEFWIDEKPLIFHSWHGSHLAERQVDFPNDDLIQDKKRLFSQIPWRIL